VLVGKDILYWNAHRVYGKRRLPLLLDGGNILGIYGLNNFDLSNVKRMVKIGASTCLCIKFGVK